MKQHNSSSLLYRILFSLRTHIVIGYVLLMGFSSVVGTFIIDQILFFHVQERIKKSLVQEMQEFRMLADGANPETSQPFGDDIISLFKVFLKSNIPDDDEFLVALLNGQIYSSSPLALPEWFKSDSQIVKTLSQIKIAEKGEFYSIDGQVIYLAQPIITDKNHGVFIVLHATSGERDEVSDAVKLIIQVMFVVTIGFSFLAWVVAGKVLKPLNLLTKTTQSIRETDLTQRIPVKGADEIAQLTITFNEMLERLETAFSSQRDFINDASHELRTPITIIRGHLELLGDDPQERQETIELVLDELDRMNRFVEDLLLLAKSEQPDFLNLEVVEINSLTLELYAKAKALAPRQWRLDALARGKIRADRQRLTQAIMNLAENATHHTKEGDAIGLGSDIRNNQLRLWVRDTGEGIPLSDQERIFQRFARGLIKHRRSNGAGLGLSIVQAIAEAHSGRIELFSRPHGGSTFTIVIPLKPIPKSSNRGNKNLLLHRPES
ncbi:HAMP domain-containing histidine kinase [Calothrix sp. FACHB-1219]|uniref:sensor histidine kinase n=1 Tax=unclassified Calothrix TaxID=2619626 RepID=UPI0016886A59|nr:MULTISPECIES: HAMP domain-containing sensor histidine kinase [unclassified Calothrix]MBD2204968.1 HAMP domain-containing histidine kinase [Calothrix sp. FACHB-168]MBD2216208.1 HAMP domain-containing histidine kinase [Calothrix sp. FACHB-1219]